MKGRDETLSSGSFIGELPKAYEAKEIENQWYQFWENQHFFDASPHSNKKPFCISIPPPNVTGVLHMGHALVNTIQDTIIRWRRMLGEEALWIPGTDHAGISTQTVVERHLMRTLGKTRRDFTREEFLEHVWKWKEESEGQILNQLRRLGCSCDWTRQRFTMDAGANRAVRTFFKRLYEDGLIYRGDYLVNWDPVTQTALADDEVEYEERSSSLWYFRYPLEDGSDSIMIATTRPETMLGDTAVAVAPNDPRYTHLIGRNLKLPLMNRLIPIIADEHVDPAFGTGAVKVTPAHDPNDYQMGLTHRLPMITIMTPDGKINANGGVYEGMTMAEARQAVVQEMQKQGFLVKTEPHTHRLGLSYRSKAVIEPYLSKQWFVRMSTFSLRLRKMVEEERVKLIPKSWESTYFHWIDHLRDWCISRQLWWGHRIPIWYSKENPDQMICWSDEGVPPEVASNPTGWYQEEDVLDTWFSAALWPLTVLGWPDQTADLARFYPNSVLVTGHDILFFWVARMLLAGEYLTGTPPFPEVFLHGLIYGKSYWRTGSGGSIAYVSTEERHEYDLGKVIPQDVQAKWEKMSKSKGNVIDPLEIIDSYGTDAMRMALCASGPQLREIDLDRRRFEEFKNFANKVWNGARFVFMNLEGDSEKGLLTLDAAELVRGLDREQLTLEDHWILSRLNHVIADVNARLQEYVFDQAALEAYDFYWKDFCANYLEISKPILSGKIGSPEQRANKQKLLVIILMAAIRLLHPMAPFITEELFQRLKARFGDFQAHESSDPYIRDLMSSLQSEACIVAPYPQVLNAQDLNPRIEEAFSLVAEVVYAIRNLRGEMQLPPSAAVDVHLVVGPNDPARGLLQENLPILSALIRVKGIDLHDQEPHLPSAATALVRTIKILLPLPEERLDQERQRLAKEQERLKQQIEKFAIQLSNQDFISKAPEKLVNKLREQDAVARTQLEAVNQKLEALS